MIAVISTPLARAEKLRVSSSIANTIPASGVLNAADSPAAAPASTSWRSICAFERG